MSEFKQCKFCGENFYGKCTHKTQTDMTHSLRTNALLRRAYDLGERNGFDELEILKRFTLKLLELNDEAFQEKLDKLMYSTQPIFNTDAQQLGSKL